ncbi:MAG TPA: ATP-binding protein [Geothrix sp.]|nr:ATP-binding protein [Geothrix sp.]
MARPGGFSWPRRLWSGSIQRRLFLGTTAVVALTLVLLVTDQINRQQALLYRQSEEQGQAVARTLALSSVSWVLASDVEGLQEVLQSLAGYPDLHYAMVLAPDGRVLAHTDPKWIGMVGTDKVSLNIPGLSARTQVLSRTRDQLDVVAPIEAGGRPIGWVRLGLGQDALNANLRAVILNGLRYGAAGILLGALIAAMVARGLTRALARLSEATRLVSRGERGVRAGLHRQDEIGQLGEAFDAMTTALDRTTADLCEREAYLQKLLVNLPVAVLVFQSDESLLYRNPAALRFFDPPGGTRGEGVDPVWNLLGEDGEPLPAGRNPVRRVLASRIPLADTVVGFRLNAGIRWALVSAYPDLDPGGQVRQVIMACQDITDRRSEEEERRRLEQQIHHVQRLESLGNLAGGVAHDMNNVLAAVLMMASAHQVKTEPGSPFFTAFETIQTACVRGRGLIRRLLDFARNQLEEVHPVDLNALVREEVELLGRTTLQKAEWVLDLDPGVRPVKGDPSALGSAIINLCVNSVDAMGRGGTVTLRTRRLADGWTELTVIDNGEGMPQEVLARALDPFFTTKAAGRGTGLGLSIVYSTMKAHGGSLEITSHPGQGTTVTLRFPPYDLGEDDHSAEQASSRAEVSHHVLLVDDDVLVREAMQPLLEGLGHTVTATASGQEALDQLEQGLPVDLAIVDQNMPGLSGDETVVQMLKLRPDLPILMASGYLAATHLGEGAPWDRIPSLAKPFSREELREALETLDQNRRRG